MAKEPDAPLFCIPFPSSHPSNLSIVAVDANATWAASSGFDQPLIIVSASSRLLELGARSWKVGRLTARNDEEGMSLARGEAKRIAFDEVDLRS